MGKIKHGSKTWVITYGTVVIFVIGNRQSDFFLVTPPCSDLPMIFRIPPFEGILPDDDFIVWPCTPMAPRGGLIDMIHENKMYITRPMTTLPGLPVTWILSMNASFD